MSPEQQALRELIGLSIMGAGALIVAFGYWMNNRK